MEVLWCIVEVLCCVVEVLCHGGSVMCSGVCNVYVIHYYVMH